MPAGKQPLHVVVVGGGFGGLAAVQALRRAPVRITLVDRRNHHLFQPLLYQVATAALSPGDIAEAIRHILRRQDNVAVLLGTADAVDVAGHRVLVDGGWIPWDRLVLATGAGHSYFGHDEWARFAPGLKTVGDALDIRRRLILSYERAEWEPDPVERVRLTTFVVIGGGPTGVELAGALTEISAVTLARDFRNIDPRQTRVILVEAAAEVLGVYDAPLPARARAQLERIGVEVRTGRPVTGIDERGVQLGDERIDAGLVLWAAGVKAEPLGASLGVPLDRAGRVIVDPDLSIPGARDVFVIGDAASFSHGRDRPVPALAPSAIQMGKHVARSIRADVAGTARSPFRFRDLGSMATIGRSKAVAQIGPVRVSGLLAWLMWVFVHLMTLVGFRNRVVVFVKWAWAWVTWESSSRLVWQGDPEAAPGAASSVGKFSPNEVGFPPAPGPGDPTADTESVGHPRTDGPH